MQRPPREPSDHRPFPGLTRRRAGARLTPGTYGRSLAAAPLAFLPDGAGPRAAGAGGSQGRAEPRAPPLIALPFPGSHGRSRAVVPLRSYRMKWVRPQLDRVNPRSASTWASDL